MLTAKLLQDENQNKKLISAMRLWHQLYICQSKQILATPAENPLHIFNYQLQIEGKVLELILRLNYCIYSTSRRNSD